MKLEITFGQNQESGVVFVNPANGKAETISYEKPLEAEQALKALKSEIGARHNVTRAALSMLVQILDRERIAGYKGVGKLGQPGGIANEAKSAMRDAETEHFKPMFPKVEQMDQFLTGLRDQGPYAVVKGVALKYFYYLGKLPCAYNPDGTPDKTRLLAVSAMQKILRQETPDTNPKTWGDRIDEMHIQFKDKWEAKDESTTDPTLLAGLIARLKQFLGTAEETLNTVNAAATQHAAIMAKVSTKNPAEVVQGMQPEKAKAEEKAAADKGKRQSRKPEHAK